MRILVIAMTLSACGSEPDLKAGVTEASLRNAQPSVRPEDASPAVHEIVEEARALLMGPGSEGPDTTSNRVRSLDGPVWTREGCIVLQGTPADAAEALSPL